MMSTAIVPECAAVLRQASRFRENHDFTFTIDEARDCLAENEKRYT